MVSTDLALLKRAIILSPQEDTPRLMYADALQERGGYLDEEWAGFIRTHIRGGCTTHPKLYDAPLYHGGDYDYYLPQICTCSPCKNGWSVWERGFIKSLNCRSEGELDDLAQHFLWSPLVQEVCPETAHPITLVTAGGVPERERASWIRFYPDVMWVFR